MRSSRSWRRLLCAALLAAAAPVAAQSPFAEDPGTALTRHLRILAESPQNLGSLVGAGDAALVLGDPQAAATFFARAEEVAPRDGRVKAALGRAFVQMEQPQAALRFFAEALSLGFPERAFAGDRGLAFDMMGDPRRAQRDYQLALAAGDDAEVRRRLALSHAISGEREVALKTIDAQLRGQDRAAWRTRAFVLALTGDPVQAAAGAEQAMPGTGSVLGPFFARFAGLGAADRARAVHFGHFPTDAPPAPPVQMAQTTRVPQASAPAARTTMTRQQGAVTLADAGAARRRPGQAPAATQAAPRAQAQGTSQAPTRTAARTPEADRPSSSRSRLASSFGIQMSEPRRAPAATRPAATPTQVASRPSTTAPAPVRTAEAAPQRTGSVEPRGVVREVQPRTAQPQPALTRTVTGLAAPTFATALAAPPPAPAAPVPVAAQPTPLQAIASGAVRPGFAEIAAAIVTLTDDRAPPAPVASAPRPVRTADAGAATRTAATRATADAVKKAPEPAQKKPTPAPPAAPSRHWVQIAGGASKADLGREFARLRAKAPRLLDARTGWTTPLRATNRLLVGPFKSEGEAQAFVNDLAKAELSAFSWTSPAGQEIEKLSAR